ncbi:hypothetical protein G3580_03800 [Nitrogeniibacter mangrovi]|uniref:Uncharacterized protein n=1 Tax=Nitrogeniibacter mangrovi TaxID=2016596 RepID=A0A6C1B3Q9_9RHOO|nr:hypothetical protein [Nitrogeniibacter mangrovi]QID16834.1 hypothetical protein G3580_03800 [Nitrogeniibacter mangrovi]
MVTQVECRGEKIGEVAPTAEIVLKELVRRICARDQVLEGLPGHVVIADDLPATLVALGEPAPPAGAIVPTVARTLYREAGPVLVLESEQVARAMGGEADDMARFVHLLHSEMWRIRLHLDALAEGEDALGAWQDSVFDSQLRPVVEAMRNEYGVTRRAVWSLPADADLMLKHLMDVVDALPPATQEDITVALSGDDLDGLFVRSLGRIAHLVQTAAHAQGYLAGLGKPLAAISPEMDAALADSFFGAYWGPLTERLGALFAAAEPGDVETRRQQLQEILVGLFASLGLQVRRAEDGGVWIEPGAHRAA